MLSEGAPRLLIYQTDVRAIQLAKAALYAGAKLLIERAGAAPERITLAGAFGSHIDPVYAMTLGLIPDCDLAKVASAGNAAGTGARIALLNLAARAEIEGVARRIEKIETAIEPAFQRHFVAAMAFPNKEDAFPNLAKRIDLPARKEPGSEGGRRRRRAAAGRHQVAERPDAACQQPQNGQIGRIWRPSREVWAIFEGATRTKTMPGSNESLQARSPWSPAPRAGLAARRRSPLPMRARTSWASTSARRSTRAPALRRRPGGSGGNRPTCAGAASRRWLGMKVDQRDLPALRAAAVRGEQEFGGIDILFANAGIQSFHPLLEMEDADWRITIDVNLTGSANALRAFAPHMVKRGGGRIILASSTQGQHGTKYGAAYAASKWGIIGLMKSAALELGRYKITVNAVVPGLIDTPLTRHEERYAQVLQDGGGTPTGSDEEAAKKILAAKTPLGVPWIDPADVAPVVVFLASDAARMVSGAAYDVTAGDSARNTA